MTPSALVICSDCLVGLRDLPDNSIDAVVTDPPSGIAFMGADWDKDKGGRDAWIDWLAEIMREVWRVTKPGGHALVWALPRTQHWTATAIENAGWDVRDVLMHVFGSGFPKSLDVSKAMDRQKHNRDQVLTVTRWIREARDAAGLSNTDIDEGFGFHGMAGHWTSQASQPAVPTLEQVPRLLEILGQEPPDDVARLIWDLNGEKGKPGPNWYKREITGTQTKARAEGSRSALPTLGAKTEYQTWDITAPATDEAKQWAGWGTALKPSHEAWILARKPLAGTVAANVLEHGTGALNIDGCRVGTDGGTTRSADPRRPGVTFDVGGGIESINAGRWPPHLLLSHAADCGETCADGCPVAEMDAQSGVSTTATYRPPIARERNNGIGLGTAEKKMNKSNAPDNYGDTGGASRFFPVFRYVAKPSTAEKSAGLGHRAPATGGEATGRKDGSAGLDNPRAGAGRNGGALNIHPTVKPRGLMEWLVKMITPPGGVVLDPFTGSGSTGVAAVGLGFDFIGFEMSEDFAGIARDRIGHAVAGVEIETVGIEDYEPKPEATGQGRLF